MGLGLYGGFIGIVEDKMETRGKCRIYWPAWYLEYSQACEVGRGTDNANAK